jgi:hypothetical protein
MAIAATATITAGVAISTTVAIASVATTGVVTAAAIAGPAVSAFMAVTTCAAVAAFVAVDTIAAVEVSVTAVGESPVANAHAPRAPHIVLEEDGMADPVDAPVQESERDLQKRPYGKPHAESHC